TSPGVRVQSHVTVAVSGSAAASVAEHAALLAPDVNTHAPLTHVACALPQSTSARQTPASDPTFTVPGNPGLPSPIEQFRRSTVNAFQPRQRSVCPSSSALTNPTSWKVSPPSQDTCLSTFATHVLTVTVRSLIRTKGSSQPGAPVVQVGEPASCSTPFVRSAVRLPVFWPACARPVAEVTPGLTTILQVTEGKAAMSPELLAGKLKAVPST